MLFSSIEFIFIFFPIAFLIYYAFSFSRVIQNIWLLLVSVLFYAWGDINYVVILCGIVLLDWIIGLVTGSKKKGSGKAWFILGYTLNVAILFVYGYLEFVLQQANAIAEYNLFPTVNIVKPLGISFFVLSSISYMSDVAKGKAKYEKNLINVGLYIAFFPKLLAGPVIKYRNMANQIINRKSTADKIIKGMVRFTIGLGKKVLIANSLSSLAGTVFNWSEFGSALVNVPALTAWLGLIAFTIQIYFDFSGYTDMAIGLGLMFGFDFPENFNYPYMAKTVTEFWEKWHMTLTSWFDEYVCVPSQANNSENQDDLIKDMFVMWLLIGIWHGSTWNFWAFGIWNFLFILGEKFFGNIAHDIQLGKNRIYTMLQVMMGWVLINTADLYQASTFIKNLVGINGNGLANMKTWFLIKEYWVYLVVGVLFTMPLAKRIQTKLDSLKDKNAVAYLLMLFKGVALIVVFITCISFIIRDGEIAFIFQ